MVDDRSDDKRREGPERQRQEDLGASKKDRGDSAALSSKLTDGFMEAKDGLARGQERQLSPPEKFEAKETRIGAAVADIMNDRAIADRFGGRNWETLKVDEKLQLLNDCERVTARMEGRKAAPVDASPHLADDGKWVGGDQWQEQAKGDYDPVNHRITLNAQETLSSKEQSLRTLFHEQTHAILNKAAMWEAMFRIRAEHAVGQGQTPQDTPRLMEGDMNKNQEDALIKNFQPENRIIPSAENKRQQLLYESQPIEVHARARSEERWQAVTRQVAWLH